MRLSFAFKRLTVMSVTLSAWLVTPALAGTKNWVNPFGGMFGDARNWSPSPPTVTDDAVFDVDSEFAVHFTTDVTTLTLRVGASDVTLDLAGFGYTLSSTVADALKMVEGTIRRTQGAAKFVLELSGDLSARQSELDTAVDALFATARREESEANGFADLNQAAAKKSA